MEEMVTIGKNYYPEYIMPIRCHGSETFETTSGHVPRYRIFIIHGGSGMIDSGSSRHFFIAPVCFCFDETERISLKSEDHVTASSIYFHPSVLNNRFEFDAIRGMAETFPLSDQQDMYLLEAFRKRTGKYKGQMPLGYNSLKRLSSLFNALERELAAQDNDSWPCRSRSFLIELLFLIMKVLRSNPASDRALLDTRDEDIERVIMYLHHNYQNDITISDLVRVCDINRTTLAERFSRETGLTIKTYLNRLRIDIARTMINDTSLPIQEIAYRTGFNDITTFGRVFRKFVSCSPGIYRSRNRSL